MQRHGERFLFLSGVALIVIGLLEARDVVVVCGSALAACAVLVSRFAPSPPPTVSEQIKADVQARIVERYRERHRN